MIMQTVTGRVFGRLLLGAFVFAGLVSCGSTTNNEQGTVLSLLGFSDSECEEDVGLFFGAVSTANGEETVGAFGGGAIAGFNVQNSLGGQTVRVDSAQLSYEIPGASAQPPSTQVPLSILLGPSPSAEPLDSSLPQAFASVANSGCSPAFIIPPEVQSWIVLNQSRLPEAPFGVIVEATVSGVSSAGDRFTSNEIFIEVRYTTGVVISPTAAAAS